MTQTIYVVSGVGWDYDTSPPQVLFAAESLDVAKLRCGDKGVYDLIEIYEGDSFKPDAFVFSPIVWTGDEIKTVGRCAAVAADKTTTLQFFLNPYYLYGDDGDLDFEALLVSPAEVANEINSPSESD